MGSGNITIVPLTSVKDNKLYHKSTVDIGEEVYFSLNKKLTVTNTEPFEDLILIEKLKNEIERMKHGSIALVGQITTVSKQRIYDPQTYKDLMSGIKISNNSLNLIDKKSKSYI